MGQQVSSLIVDIGMTNVLFKLDHKTSPLVVLSIHTAISLLPYPHLHIFLLSTMYARGFPYEARSEYALSISMLSLSTLPPLTALLLTLSRPKLFSQLLRTTLIF